MNVCTAAGSVTRRSTVARRVNACSGAITPTSLLPCSSTNLRRNADAAQRFARAIHRANAALEANGDLKRAAAQRSLNIAPELATRMQFEEMQTRIDPAQIQWWIDAGRRFNLVEGTLAPGDFLYETVR